MVPCSNPVVGWLGEWRTGTRKCLFYLCMVCSCMYQNDTLIRYLLDELGAYESGHGDALRPVPSDPSRFFMGEHLEVAPATAAHISAFSDSLQREFGEMKTMVSKILISPHPFQWPSITPATISSSLPFPFQPAAHGISTAPIPTPTVSPTNIGLGVHLPPTAALPHQSPLTFPPLQLYMHNDGAAAETSSGKKKKRPIAVLPDIPGRVIRKLPNGGKAWRVAVDQWELGYPDLGIMPLKDWEKEWYTGRQSTVYGSTYCQRRSVALAFQRYHINL